MPELPLSCALLPQAKQGRKIQAANSSPQQAARGSGQITEFMTKHNIGVTSTRTISLKRIDSDYVEEN
jgi:restriction endonuclease Mrr